MGEVPSKPWVVFAKVQPRLRLFCFPYAGGGSSLFRLWSNGLPPEVEVCPVYLPGREIRLNEAAFTHISPLVQTMAQVLRPHLNTPFAFFGHSMGALISFELARYLRRNYRQLPTHLFVSSHRAPQLPRLDPDTYNLPEPAFIDAVYRLGGTPQEVLQHEELLQILLPTLRADFTLCETYLYAKEEPLACPITAFGGEQDHTVSVQQLSAWREQTRGVFTLHMLPGGHFFLHKYQGLLLQALSGQLGELEH
ncbi:MAG: thioesterase [Ktedonobacteraceae bacterium]|nr:thioesterase [Ktedonobacteraceae bacterium]